MSTISSDSISTCANCGKGSEGEEDSIKLKSCAACKLVKYCSRECQAAHRPQHKRECKKRAAELHDELLFKVPPPNEDCPICFLQLPTLHEGSKYMACCGKRICSGCIYANAKLLGDPCPFCRTPGTSLDIDMVKKRVEMNDANAIACYGMYYDAGTDGCPQNKAKAFELYLQAGELGNADAYLNLGNEYGRGVCVERDMKKAKHYYELAAMAGGAQARHNLGALEFYAGNFDRALKHYMIAAGGGYAKTLNAIKELYTDGHATKDDYAKALQVYQSYLDEIKSVQRDKAAAFSDEFKYY